MANVPIVEMQAAGAEEPGAHRRVGPGAGPDPRGDAVDAERRLRTVDASERQITADRSLAALPPYSLAVMSRSSATFSGTSVSSSKTVTRPTGAALRWASGRLGSRWVSDSRRARWR